MYTISPPLQGSLPLTQLLLDYADLELYASFYLCIYLSIYL